MCRHYKYKNTYTRIYTRKVLDLFDIKNIISHKIKKAKIISSIYHLKELIIIINFVHTTVIEA